MIRILYIGNALSKTGKTTTSIETLSTHLAEFCTVKIASKKSNKILRLLDMIKHVIANRNQTEYLLIDTYSTTNFYYALIISQLSRLFKIKYIPILHGGNLESRLKNNPRMSKLIFKNAHTLVSPSNFLKTVFEKYGYKKVKYIPNTIEIENFEFQNRAVKDIKLLWVRSFSKIYNPEMAILVLENLVKNGCDATLTMVGPEVDGSMQKAKDLCVNKGLDVNFTGKLSRQEWVKISRNCNVFINTTNYDNTPVSVIEAMALGLPIVSTNVGGIPYLVSHNSDGLLVSQNDINAMVKAILNLKNDYELGEQLVINARKKVEQFDWELVKVKWESLLS